MKDTATGLHLFRCHDATVLAGRLADYVREPVADPFAEPLVLVPGAAVQRWLSQQIASAAPQGVCAGVRFESSASLEALLGGPDPVDDPWAPERLVWPILELVAEGAPGLEPLAHNLAASEQRYANAARVAHVMHRYVRYRPEMLQAWQREVPAGLGFDVWQAHLWRHLRARIDAPDPTHRVAELVERLDRGAIELSWPRVFWFAPRRVAPVDVALVTALARRVRVEALAIEPRPGLATRLAGRLGRAGADSVALLAAAATSDTTLAAAAAEPAIEVHASHGPQRQAEVLREVLTGLFADDPGLEPRDVVVATTDIAAMSGHLAAAFPSLDEPGGPRHPAAELRVQIADRSAAETNQVFALVRQLIQLHEARATASDLLALCAHPFVARRFGLRDQSLERLAELVPQASIRWGLNPAHRERAGVASVRQGTWQGGVQRLLLGTALSAENLAHVGDVATVDAVGSSDVELVGALAELFTRVSHVAGAASASAPPARWAALFREATELLIDVPFDQQWQLAQFWSATERIERRSGESTIALGAADALALLDAEFASRTTRPSYGNGSLVVAPLAAVSQVPHRVVCLVGLDERTFPRRGIADGDDLLAADPRPGDPDPGADDRQALLDALGAATDRLVIVYQGRSSLTNEVHHPPAGLVDLIEASGAHCIDEALQPFSPSYFAGSPTSFDRSALTAARALLGPRRPAPEPFAVGWLPLAEPVTALDLDQLATFVLHPARYFLRQRAQLSIGFDDPITNSVPIELDHLERWSVSERMLELRLAGHSPEAVRTHAWLSGDVPPGRLGERLVTPIAHDVEHLVRERDQYPLEPTERHIIDLDLAGVRVTGRVVTRAGLILDCAFSRTSPKRTARAWISALALARHLGRPVEAVLLGRGKPVRISTPEPGAAARLLTEIVSLAIDGLQRVLPMPVGVAHLWARARLFGQDPLADRGLEGKWKQDSDDTWRLFYPPGVRPWQERVTGEPWAQPGEPTALGSLAAVVWGPIVRALP